MTESDTSQCMSTAVHVYVDTWVQVGLTHLFLHVCSCECSWVTVHMCLCRRQCVICG